MCLCQKLTNFNLRGGCFYHYSRGQDIVNLRTHRKHRKPRYPSETLEPIGNATQANSIFPFYHRSSESTVSDMSRSESSNLSREESYLSLEPLYVNSISRSSSERSGTGARDVLVSPLGETTEFLPIKVIAPDMQGDILGLLNPIFEDYHRTMVKIYGYLISCRTGVV